MFLQKSPKFKTSSLCSQDTGSSNAIWTNNKQRKTNIHLSVKTRVHWTEKWKWKKAANVQRKTTRPSENLENYYARPLLKLVYVSVMLVSLCCKASAH